MQSKWAVSGTDKVAAAVPQTVRLMLFCYDLLGGFAFLDPARLSSAMQALSSYFASGQDAPAACAQSSSDRIGWTTSQGHFLRLFAFLVGKNGESMSF